MRRFEGTGSHTLQRADAEKVMPRLGYSVVDIHSEKKEWSVVRGCSRLVLGQDIDCVLRYPRAVCSCWHGSILGFGAAKHKDNARSITEYKTFDWIHSRKLGKGRGRVGDSRQPQRNSRHKPNASKFLPLFLKPQIRPNRNPY